MEQREREREVESEREGERPGALEGWVVIIIEHSKGKKKIKFRILKMLEGREVGLRWPLAIRSEPSSSEIFACGNLVKSSKSNKNKSAFSAFSGPLRTPCSRSPTDPRAR